MLEMLLITACYFGNIESCQNSGQAYYKYSGIDKNVQEYGEKHIMLSYTVMVIGVYNQKKVVLPITPEISTVFSPTQYTLNYGIGF